MKSELRFLVNRWMASLRAARIFYADEKFCKKHEEAFDRWIETKQWTDYSRSFDDEAISLGLTREELNAYCKCRYGKTFLSFRTQLRVVEARDIIAQHPELSMQQAGEMAGFADRKYLERSFREIYGESPASWRKRIK